MSVTFTSLSPEIGAQTRLLTGVGLLRPDAVAALQAALDASGVVICHGADLSDSEFAALGRALGNPVVPPRGGDPVHPEIDTITLDPAKSRLTAVRRGTFFWHIDGTRDDLPQKATMLLARQVADADGDTEFASTYAAWKALPDNEKKQLAGLRVTHSFTAAQLLANPAPSPKERAAWDTVPTREHPLVWTRSDGRASLLIGATADQVVGMAHDESRALLERLLDWSTQDRFTLRHHWHPGDLVIWDNTGMLHRALPYRQASACLMRRITFVGEEAVA
ncbi:TauD/TfdA family dioxygenase [Streptomyces sp. NPDC048278]|uniref:TauD/TfdA dioxygenase family protein n=1 Tax=Streptomyces sp. NPDC048278 TaxID=3155809 RepID=UPI00343ED37A